MLSAGLSGRRLCQIIRIHASGRELRLRLSNRYGLEAVTLAAISIAPHVQGPEVAEPAVQVTFDGQRDVVLEPGEEKNSDAVSMNVEAFNSLAISFDLVKGEALTGHTFASQTSYISTAKTANGAEPPKMAFSQYPLMTSSWWLLAGLHVLPSTPVNVLVAFGSSTTDGTGSTPNANNRWPDHLARRLKEAGGSRYMSVVNAGLAGNQLLSAEDAYLRSVGVKIPEFMLGDAGLRRCEWDLALQPGATDLILHIGSNDLRAGVGAERLFEGFREIVKSARRVYKKVFGTTILPGGYSAEQALQRQLFNEWVLQQGGGLFDAVFDLGTPLGAETDGAKMAETCDSGDGIHPNDHGYKLMADAIDISKLSGSPSPEV